MYLVDALKVLRRQWGVVLLGMILMAGGAAWVIRTTPTDYQATGQLLLLLPPDASGEKTPTNPYLNLQGGQTTAASLLAGEMMTKDTSRELVGEGLTSEYVVTLDPGAGPLLGIVVEDTDPQLAIATRDALISRMEARLSSMQAAQNVPDRQLMRMTPVSVSGNAEVLPGAKLRALAALGGGGMVLTLLAVFAVDRLRRSRRNRLQEADALEVSEPVPADVAEPDEADEEPELEAGQRPKLTIIVNTLPRRSANTRLEGDAG